MIFVTGDTHGEIGKISEHLEFIKENILIVLGDFGFVWNKSSSKNLDYLEQKYKKSTICFIDGNHENFDLLEQFPIIDKWEGKVSKIRKNIFWLRRGEIYNIENNKILTIGGALSVDKNNRIPYFSWWEQENLKHNEINLILKKFVYENKFDFVLTHTCPTSIVRKFFHCYDKKDSNSDFFEHILKEKLFSFKKWYFGHFHEDVVITQKFECLYNNIKKLT